VAYQKVILETIPAIPDIEDGKNKFSLMIDALVSEFGFAGTTFVFDNLPAPLHILARIIAVKLGMPNFC
jgi:hypothetical protein